MVSLRLRNVLNPSKKWVLSFAFLATSGVALPATAATVVAEYSAFAGATVTLTSATYAYSGQDAFSQLGSSCWYDCGDFAGGASGQYDFKQVVTQRTNPPPSTYVYSLDISGYASRDDPISQADFAGNILPSYTYSPTCLTTGTCDKHDNLLLTFDYLIEERTSTSVYSPLGTATASADARLDIRYFGYGSGVFFPDFRANSGSGTYGVLLRPGDEIGLFPYAEVHGGATYTAPPIVPLPASGWLLLLGLGALATSRRRLLRRRA